MTARELDVFVAGLGPAGARAARAAASAGCRVLAIDRKRVPGRPVQCAELVPAMLAAEVEALAASVSQAVSGMETFVEGEDADTLHPFPGHMLDRAAFDAALVEAARAAGAECRFAATLRRVHGDGLVELSDGTRFRARVVIGADGPRSLVGRAAGRVNAALVDTRQVTVPLRVPHAATDIFLSAAYPGGYGWLFPKGGVANVGVGVEPSRRGALKGLVARLHARLAGEGRVGREALRLTGGAIPVGGMLDPVARLGESPVLLAGDAAGLANPVTGAGIAAAVRSGTLAGETAARLAAGESGAAREYAEELEALFGASLARALARRRELLARPRPAAADLRRAWIAYPQYWNAGETA